MPPSLRLPPRWARPARSALCALACTGLWLGVAAAQTLSLNPLEPAAGSDVTVTGRGLPPGGQVTSRLTAPGGRVSRQSAQVGDAGRFSLKVPIPTGGRYQLHVRGPGVERTWELDVPKPVPAPPDGAALPSPPEPARPGGQSLTPPPAPSGRLTVSRAEGGLQAARGETVLWTLTFPAESGRTAQPLLLGTTPPRLYAGHGASVLELEPATGAVRERWPVSGPVARLERVHAQTVAITVRHSDTLSERFTLVGGALQEPVRFGVDLRTFGYLRAEADVPDPAARLRQDPTNPWLYLRLGLRAADPAERRAAFLGAVRRGETFYDLAGIATALEAEGERGLAGRAFGAAMQDFARRGYNPRLLTDPGLEAAYGFPLGPLRRALAAESDLSAGFWAERLLLAAPFVPGAAAAFAEYAALVERVGTPSAAAWRGRVAALAGPGPSAAAPPLSALTRSGWGQLGWSLTLAFLGAAAALHLTLEAKYACARRTDQGGGRTPWRFALRYASLSEKLVLLLVLAAALACAALASGLSGRGGLPSRILGSGTLANRAAGAYLDGAALSGRVGAFVRGTAQLAAGERGAAVTALGHAGTYAPALNNLGVLRDDPALFAQARRLEPGLAAARFNTGDSAALPFEAAYRPGASALALPTPADFSAALRSGPQGALADLLTNPWRAFQGAPPGLSAALWRSLQLLFLLVLLVHLVYLFIPRPRSASGAPRPWAYTLLALLFPGTGLADEAWGIFLLLPWAAAGTAALSQGFGWGLLPPLSLLPLLLVLGGLYLLNTAAVAVEGMAHRSRQGTRPEPRVTRRA